MKNAVSQRSTVDLIRLERGTLNPTIAQAERTGIGTLALHGLLHERG